MGIDVTLVLADLKRDEGRRTRPYADSRGIQTIGYGHNLVAAGLCEAAITAQLTYDLDLALQSLTLKFPWWVAQPAPVQRVLLNLCYNTGIGGLATFTTFLGLIQARKYPEAAQALLQSKYATQVGDRAVRLAELLKTTVIAP